MTLVGSSASAWYRSIADLASLCRRSCHLLLANLSISGSHQLWRRDLYHAYANYVVLRRAFSGGTRCGEVALLR